MNRKLQQTQVSSEREVNDFYATNPEMLRLLLKSKYAPPKDKIVWECACGLGHLSKELERNEYRVFSTDLIDRNWDGMDCQHDFISTLQPTDLPDLFKKLAGEDITILTNPPFKHSVEFVETALDKIKDGEYVYMLMKSLSIHGQTRYNKIFQGKGFKYYLPLTKRYNCYKNGDETITSSSCLDYAWFVWQKGFEGSVILDWLV